jgi:hypothetical protein
LSEAGLPFQAGFVSDRRFGLSTPDRSLTDHVGHPNEWLGSDELDGWEGEPPPVSPHRQRLVDGSVRNISLNISVATWWAACTPSGGEVVANDW